MIFKKNKLLYFTIGILIFSCQQNEITNETITDIGQGNNDSLLLVQYSHLSNELAEASQLFTLNLEKEQQIIGLNGTIITFDKGCFEATEINLELIECYSKMDMIKNALSTVTSDGKLLESQGMLYLNITDKQGNVLKPKAGKLNIKVPVEPDTDCNFFNGERQNGIVVWEENKEILINKVTPPSKKEKVKYAKFIVNNWAKGDTIRDTTWGYQYKEVVSSMKAFYSMFNPLVLGWYNLDRYEESEKIDFVSNSTLNEACIVIMIPQELNTVVHCASFMEYNEVGLSIKKVPDLNADFLFLRYVNNQFYYDLVGYKQGGKTKLNIKLKPISKTDLNSLLKQRYGKKFTNDYIPS